LGDIKQPNFDVWLTLSKQIGSKTQKVSIHADADMGSSSRVKPYQDILPMYNWLSDNVLPVSITADKREDIFFNLTTKTISLQKVVMLYIVPGLLLLFSIVF